MLFPYVKGSHSRYSHGQPDFRKHDELFWKPWNMLKKAQPNEWPRTDLQHGWNWYVSLFITHPKLLDKKEKVIRCCVPGNKAKITVVACISASGQAIPPCVIFDTKQLNHAWTKDKVPGSWYGLSNKGWIDNGCLETGQRIILSNML